MKHNINYMKKPLFKGSAVALVTPFNKSGDINYFELKSLIEFQIASGTKAIVLLGTTGEASTITPEEREKIIKYCVSLINKRIPLIVGTGSNSTATTIMLTKQAEQLGADGVLVVTPYYNKCNQNGLIEHYKTIAKSTKLKIILYNVPSRTGVNILPQTAIKLAKIKNIVGIKEASGNISQICELLNKKPEDFYVYSGDDMLTFPMMCMGAIGVISVTANCYPSHVSMLCESMLSEEFYQAKIINKNLYQINKNLFLDVNPICIKYYLSLIGRDVGGTRLPLTEPSKEIKSILKTTKLYYEN